MDQASGLRSIIKQSEYVTVGTKPMARVITITSGKGGVGKSNTAINIALNFQKMGKKVIILDADFGLANIEIMFGTVPQHNLSDLIYKGMHIKDVITQGPGGVGFISGGSGIAGMSNLSHEYLTYIVQNLAELDSIADVIIIDTGAGISEAVLEFLVASGEIILVTTPEPTSITDSYSLLKALNRHIRFKSDSTDIKVIANRVPNKADGEILYKKLAAVVNRYLGLKISYLGAVVQDQALSNAVMLQKPVALANPNCKSAQAFAEITAGLNNNEGVQNIKKRGMAAFFSHLVANKKV
ncbi:MAG: MinD/ParA family protein [Lachnospiraceae bacterium]|nr:MinD/ParA family protein [Lachnospiraceae bacterium]